MCDTGIALLAYMDGITGSPTLGGVVLAVLAAAGYAVFKVPIYLSYYKFHIMVSLQALCINVKYLCYFLCSLHHFYLLGDQIFQLAQYGTV